MDDDAAFAQGLASELADAGYETVRAADGQEGLELFKRCRPDLVLTDDVMPRLYGFELIEAIRLSDETPIIVISEGGSDRDRVSALDLGADDYLAKPFSFNELLARVRAQLRRLGDAGPAVLEFHGLKIDRERRRVLQGERLEREVRLTPTEFAILEVLALSAGRPVANAQIAARVWKGRLTADTRTPSGSRSAPFAASWSPTLRTRGTSSPSLGSATASRPNRWPEKRFRAP